MGSLSVIAQRDCSAVRAIDPYNPPEGKVASWLQVWSVYTTLYMYVPDARDLLQYVFI